ncbi:unnamed protein product [Rotaria magnacalcarata]|uniref:Uncharacterized protein n=2 Tax=Rotaria magnacalcarata TaxID=392030 RepID=A0A816DJH8_9BILA|nr:unnamed protein product [Rotaria magnacalcarata]
MQVKFFKQISDPVNGEAQISAVCFSPNGQKLAICIDRVVQLYDETGELRDRFATKPIDSKYGRQSYVVTAMDFSPESNQLAVAQSDNIVFVYKLGADWNDKKSIVAKFVQSAHVTTLIWLPDGQIIFGLADGKIRSGNVKKNKSHTLFTAEQYTVSLAANVSRKAILSGHGDGSICRYIIEDEGTGDKSGLVVRHSCPPCALVWSAYGILVGGCDRRVVVYSKDGKILQQFDYSREINEREFSTGICNPTGQECVFGSYDHIRLYSYQARKGMFDEAPSKEIKNMYTVTGMAWRSDGARFAVANLTGGTFLFNCSLKKSSTKGKYAINFVSLSQVLIENKSNGKRADLVSRSGFEIVDVKIMGRDRYAVGYTTHTLILVDLEDEKRRCEVHWQSAGDEKFSFDNENVCMIFANGELTLIEYTPSGRHGDNILCSVRTEFLSPNLISVRVEERNLQGNKKMGYLLDSRTIAIVDLMSTSGAAVIDQVNHDANINWLALNETSRYLLFRDKNLKLYLYNLLTRAKTCILSFCIYAQWIPDSDVVVGQSQDNLSVWYNIEHPESCDTKPIKGDVIEISKDPSKNRTFVKLNDNGVQSSLELDSNKIEFNTAINDEDFRRAVAYLDACGSSDDTSNALWETLARLAYEKQEYVVAEQAYTATRQMAKARFLHSINQLAREKKGSYEHYEVRAKLAIFERQLKVAESIYLENGDVDKAIDMYRTMHHWDEAISVADRKRHPQADELRSTYYKWLIDTKQIARAADWKLKQHEDEEAISLYMQANLPSKSAQILMQNAQLMRDSDLVTRIAVSLVKANMFELAGDLYEHVKESPKALSCYEAGKCFLKAVKLARKTNPKEVVALESKWGDYMAEQMQYLEAVTHFIEAGENMKAVQAAILGRQWPRALEILEQQRDDNDPEIAKHYKQLAIHFAHIQEFEKAERCYLKAQAPGECVEMYNRASKWEHAFRLAKQYMNKDEVTRLYSNQAKELEAKGRYKEAEKLYITINDNAAAILMYKRMKNYDALIRLVRQYYPDKMKDTEITIAKELEQEKRYKEAEMHYIQAGDWKSAANMYRLLDSWDDAYRIARQHGGPVPAQQVAFFWAKKLGGDAGVKLLNKLGHAEQALELACEQHAYEFAFDIARLLLKDKLPEVHYKYALHLEDERRYLEAEAEFLKAKKPRDAVLMYVQIKDWDRAQRIAQANDKALLNDVLIGQAKQSFDNNDFPKAESYLLQAQRPDLAVKLYKDNGLTQDALRVCQEYMPNKLDDLREELTRSGGMNETRMNTGAGNRPTTSYNNDNILEQAARYETQGEYQRAVELYLRLMPQQDIPKETLVKAYLKASDLARKFLPENKAQHVIRTIGPRLVQLGQPNQAAEQYLHVELHKEAVEAFIAGKQWEKAKKLALEVDPQLAKYVDDLYKKHLKERGNAKELMNVDVTGALDLFVEKNQWEECFVEAQKHGPLVLHSYLAKYATQMIQSNRAELAASVYKQYGAIAIPQNLRIYKALFYRMLRIDSLKHENYPKWADVRDVLHDVFENMNSSASGSAGGIQKEIEEQRPTFEILLWVAHMNAMRSACSEHEQLDIITAKLSISLLRHSDILPVDRAFYEAGIMCRKVGWNEMSMLFLNRYLDVVDAIEEHNPDMLATSDFVETDIPYEIELPDQPSLPAEHHEKIKEHVLALSMKQAVKPTLRRDARNCIEFSLINPETSEHSSPCLITGYPVLEDAVVFDRYNLMANKEDWNKFVLSAKSIRREALQDCLKFLAKWTGSQPNVNIHGQILAALLIVVSFLALMTLIYFLLEDLLKERIHPFPTDTNSSKSFTVQEIKTFSRHESPVPPPPPKAKAPASVLIPAPAPAPVPIPAPAPVDDIAILISTPPILPPFPRIPTPPSPRLPPPIEKPVSPSAPERILTPPLEKAVTPLPPKPPTPQVQRYVPQFQDSPPPYITHAERLRQELLSAIDERTIPALEEAIQHVKDHNCIQPLKYECERALELLNRLMKIEHMKIKVLRLNQSTIAELHSYAKPPDEVSTVMRATFLLLGHSEREIQDWPQIQSILGRFGKESIRRRCYELNPLNIPVEKAREARDILRHYDLIRVTEISVGLSVFFNWTMTMIEEREKLLESQRRIIR